MNLEQAILETLTASPKALTPAQIAGFAGSFTGGTETVADVQRALKRLQEKGHAKGTRTGETAGDGEPEIKWKETTEGRLRIS